MALYLIFIGVVFPLSLPVRLCLLRSLHCRRRVPDLSGAEDRAQHLYSGALMESLRLKWQEVKGECTENSRQLHTTTAAVVLPNHSTVMAWRVCVSVCVFVCVCVFVYVRMAGRGGELERFLCEDYERYVAINSFCSQAFIFCWLFSALGF